MELARHCAESAGNRAAIPSFEGSTKAQAVSTATARPSARVAVIPGAGTPAPTAQTFAAVGSRCCWKTARSKSDAAPARASRMIRTKEAMDVGVTDVHV